jgi:membrane protease YdiL (CAAX protease family)
MAGGAFLPQTRRFFQGDLIVQADAREAAYHSLLRIPQATAVSEELIFRTALEGTLARRYSRLWAALGGAKLFGLWHIIPALDRRTSNPGMNEGHPAGVVAAAVATTAAGGLFLSFLRERSGSIVAPMLVHAAVNSGAYLGGWFAHKMNEERVEAPVAPGR